MTNYSKLADLDRQSANKRYLNNNKIKKKVKISRVDFEKFVESDVISKGNSLDILTDVPMEVKVELGKTVKQVKDVLTLEIGSVVQLDSIAGDDIDILLNDMYVAKGEVIIADNKYVVRISKINEE